VSTIEITPIISSNLNISLIAQSPATGAVQRASTTRYISQRFFVQFNVGQFRKISLRFVLRNLKPFCFGQRHQFVRGFALHYGQSG